MKALVKDGDRLELQELPLPVPAADEVRIRVRAVGLCRSDLLVMQGKLPAISPLIPGHEFAGEIEALGRAVTGFETGQAVSAHPLIGCGNCPHCLARQPEHCHQTQMIGMQRQGAFVEYLCLPAHALWRLPDHLSWLQGAYSEPLAAAFGIFDSQLKPAQRGWVLGHNRISELSSRLLKWRGFSCGQGSLAAQPDNSLDFVVETGLEDLDFDQICRVLKPGGSLIAKSRHLDALPLPWSQLVRKDLRLEGHYYGPFAQVREFLQQPADMLGPLFEGLIGPSFRLEDWRDFIAAGGEHSKPFLVMD